MSLCHRSVRVASRLFTLAAVGSLSLLFAAPPARAGEPSFTGVGVPHAAVNTWAYGVSYDGSVVCGTSHHPTWNGAWRWTDPARGGTGMQLLGFLPGGGTLCIANGISADGRAIVGRCDSTEGQQAFRWTDPAAGGRGMEGLGDLPGGGFSSVAKGVSADGRVITGYGTSTLSTEGSNEAFRWTDPAFGGNGMQALGDIPGSLFFSVGNAISADGTAITGSGVSASSYPGPQGTYWPVGAGPIPLPDLSGGTPQSVAYALSADGHVIVGASAGFTGVLACRWTYSPTGGGGPQPLGDLPGGAVFSTAYGISADGGVVVGDSMSSDPTSSVFIWTAEDGMRNLRDMLTELGVDTTGWQLNTCSGISGDGRTITGSGVNPQGVSEGWVAHLGSPWQNEWHALAGSDGEPVLQGTGTLVGGTQAKLALSGARPFSAAALFLGFAQLGASFKGGVLVPVPSVAIAGLATGAAGAFTLSATWPAGLPSDFTFWSQAWIADPAGPQGYAASNGLSGTAP